MNLLTDNEVAIFINAVSGLGDYKKTDFDRVVRKIRLSKGLAPDGVVYETRDWPIGIHCWRVRRDWAIKLMERHQAAAKSAHIEYWRVFMEQSV